MQSAQRIVTGLELAPATVGPGGGSAIFNNYSWVDRGCDDEIETACQGVDDNGINYANCTAGRPASLPCIPGTCAGLCTSGTVYGTAAFVSGGGPCSNDPTLAGGTMCDKRTAPMIACELQPLWIERRRNDNSDRCNWDFCHYNNDCLICLVLFSDREAVRSER